MMAPRIGWMGRWVLAGIVAVNVHGCGSDPRPIATTIWDSAGVRIVENSAPQFTDVGVRTHGHAVLVLESGSSARGAALFPDGAVAILDADLKELRCYSRQGVLLGRASGEGNGPGEFRRPTEVVSYRGDTVAVFDPGNGRISLFTPDATFRRSVVVAVPAPRVALVGALPDGGFVLRAGAFTPHQGTWREPTQVIEVPGDGGVLDTITTVAGEEFYRVSFAGGPVVGLRPFGRHSLIGVSRDVVVINTQDDCVTHLVDREGATRVSARIPCSRRQLSKRRIRAFAAERVAQFRNEAARRRAVSLFQSGRLPFPTHLPSFNRLVTGADGSIWLEQSSGEPDAIHVWNVVDSAGRLLSVDTLPAGFAVHAVHDDRIVGLVQDDFGTVRVEVRDRS